MSVATQHSPFTVGSKRNLYESEENEDRLQRLDSTAASQQVAAKRYRARGSPSRCGAPAADNGFAYSVGQATHAALRGLFPEMSDKVIADVLAEYGDNIDAAIKHLTDLRLSNASNPAAAAAAAAAGASTPDQQQQQQQAAAAAAAEHQQQQQQQQQEAGASERPQSAEEWVDIVVREMASATDMADARARAAKVLQGFEQVAVEHSKQAAQQEGGESERLRAQLAEALRENQLLKRAVTIQNSRMQELSGKEAEVAQLRAMLEGFQQKVHALEVQNYSLALHLKQATDGKDATQAPGFRNPDIF